MIEGQGHNQSKYCRKGWKHKQYCNESFSGSIPGSVISRMKYKPQILQ